ncbi:MAG TPA: mechanosensitive ion channel domain-containing protein [Burkholderiaceae bacterium]|nr:mechanosensitive ion channel domain-containing protein [Burkholderiaceae bacterium]
MAAPAEDIGALIASLQRPSALIELATLAGCLVLAWLVVRLVRGNLARPSSVWFGERIFDGVLFPALALAFAVGARWLLARSGFVEVLAVFRLAVPILASLLMIRVAVRVLRVAFPQSNAVRVVERTVSWLVWIALVLWVTGALPLLLEELDSLHWKVGGVDVSLRSLLEGALSAAVVLVAALWVSAAIESRLLAGATDNLSVRKIAANAVRALLLLVGLLLALTAAGIPLGALSVLGGAVGVGIGFGLQKLAANYVSGFVILAERSLRIGDMVKVDGFEGRITDINTRFTVVRALNGRESIVPNEMLITQRIENSSLADPKVSINTNVQVAYGTDLDTLLPRLTQAVTQVPRVLADPAPAVQLAAFGADGLDLQVGFWIRDPENGQGNVKSDVNLSILRTLNEAGIEIPYPQRVVRNA